MKLISAEGSWTHYMFNYLIQPNQSAKFKLKIVITPSGSMPIGVTDYAKNKDNRCSYGTSNKQYMCYYGNNGHKYPESAK